MNSRRSFACTEIRAEARRLRTLQAVGIPCLRIVNTTKMRCQLWDHDMGGAHREETHGSCDISQGRHYCDPIRRLQ